VRGSLAISNLGCCGTSDRAPRRGPRVSKTTAQRVARVLAVVGIGRAATEVGGNWPANHAPREPGRQRTISSSSLAVPCPASTSPLPPPARAMSRPVRRCRRARTTPPSTSKVRGRPAARNKSIGKETSPGFWVAACCTRWKDTRLTRPWGGRPGTRVSPRNRPSRLELEPCMGNGMGYTCTLQHTPRETLVCVVHMLVGLQRIGMGAVWIPCGPCHVARHICHGLPRTKVTNGAQRCTT
jgi:hypothetical protein